MKPVYIFLFAFINPFLFHNTGLSETTVYGNSFKKIQKDVEKISRKQNIPAFALYIQKEDAILDVKYHHPELQPQSTYGVGSTTKLLASILIFKLIEDEKLSLNDLISTYVDEVTEIENASELTIKQVLNHTSGIPDYTKNPQWIQDVIKGKAPKNFTEKFILIDKKLKNTGTFLYSNSNYLFLEKIVESITNQSFEKAFNHFYQKLGFKTIQIGSVPENAIAFFAQTSTSSSNVSSWREHYGFDGGAYATAEELNTFLQQAFIQKTILKQETLHTMQTWISMKPMTVPIGKSGTLDEYGYGIMKLTYNGKTYFGHSGGTLKYQSFLFYNETDKTTISFTTNCSGQQYNNVFFQALVPSILDKL